MLTAQKYNRYSEVTVGFSLFSFLWGFWEEDEEFDIKFGGLVMLAPAWHGPRPETAEPMRTPSPSGGLPTPPAPWAPGSGSRTTTEATGGTVRQA